MSIQRYIYETLHPDIYHGYGKKPPFFEGWYYKLISADEKTRYAVIPGIFRAENSAEDHAFVQVLNGITGDATYHRYDINDFHAHEEIFDIWIGGNHFRRDCLSLNIADNTLQLNGEIQVGDGKGWPVSLRSPGVMGWYAWLPFMECYHGIVSFDHSLSGSLSINGENLNFNSGRGYIEKDWGQAFPTGYVWMQTNHFSEPGTSLSASIAIIPSVGRTFRGFLIGFYHQGMLYRLTTYTGAKTTTLDITDDEVIWHIEDKQYRLELSAKRVSGGLLLAPIRTEMHKRVDETLNSSVQVKFSRRGGGIIFEDEGRNAGLEVHGDLETLLRLK